MRVRSWAWTGRVTRTSAYKKTRQSRLCLIPKAPRKDIVGSNYALDAPDSTVRGAGDGGGGENATAQAQSPRVRPLFPLPSSLFPALKVPRDPVHRRAVLPVRRR